MANLMIMEELYSWCAIWVGQLYDHMMDKEQQEFVLYWIKNIVNIPKVLTDLQILSILNMDEFTYIVAMEKWLSVWHNTGGTDNKVTAKCLAIGQLDVNRPGPYWEARKAWGMKSWRKKGGSLSPSRKSSSHQFRVWVFAAGNWAAPQRWRSFPLHTGIPLKLCGTPEHTAERRDSGKAEGGVA